MSRILKALLLLFLVQAVIVHCEEDEAVDDTRGEVDEGGKMGTEDHEDEDNEGGEMGAEDHEDEDNDGGEMGAEDDDTIPEDEDEEADDDEYKDPKKIMEAIDTNKDGKISLEEITAKLREESDGDEPEMVKESNATSEKAFKQSDKNGDGFIQEEEMPKMLEALNEEGIMEAIDANKDGKISWEEITAKVMEESDGDEPEKVKESIAASEKAFKQSDKNADGFLQEEEMPKMLKALNE